MMFQSTLFSFAKLKEIHENKGMIGAFSAVMMNLFLLRIFKLELKR